MTAARTQTAVDLDARRQIGELREALVRLTETIERLARLEERHAAAGEALSRAFSKLSAHDDRITALERAAPLTTLATRWVFNGVLMIASGVGGAVMTQVLK